MKTLKIISILAVALLVIACHSNKSADSISGIYVISFTNEFSVANDTLIIQSYNLAANTYEIRRKGGFHRIRDGKILPKEFRQEQWIATFDPDRLILQEGQFGRQIYFKDDGHSLRFHGTYQKIK